MSEIKKTPLYDDHIKLNGKMVEFAGFSMPVQYSGVIKEHINTRTNIGLFDVSHMGEIIVEGDNAVEYLNNIISNDISTSYDGRAQYTPLLNDHGGIIDDIIIYRFNEKKYFICVNASNQDKDFAWFKENNNHGVSITNLSDEYVQIAVQGPKSIQLLEDITGLELSKVKYYHFIIDKFPGNIETIYSKTGYTGEKGFELYVSPDNGSKVWNTLLEEGKKYDILPVGLGARDTLRLEKGFPLYGHELSDEISPLEAGLNRFVKLDKKSFLSKNILMEQQEKGLKKKLYGFKMIERGIAREHYKVILNGKEAGFVTSGTHSPILKEGIGMAYINDSNLDLETEIAIEIRGKGIKAKITKTPFI